MFQSRNLNHRINGFPKKARNARTAIPRGDIRTAATSKMELFVIIVNVFHPLTIIRKCSFLDVATALDQPPIPIGQR